MGCKVIPSTLFSGGVIVCGRSRPRTRYCEEDDGGHPCGRVAPFLCDQVLAPVKTSSPGGSFPTCDRPVCQVPPTLPLPVARGPRPAPTVLPPGEQPYPFPPQPPARPGVTVEESPTGPLLVRFPYDPAAVEKIKEVRGRRWDPAAKAWTVPAAGLAELLKRFPEAQLLGALGERAARERAEAEAAAARDAAETARLLAALEAARPGLGLYAHQLEGVRFLLARRTAIVADDMGLGKTRQALAAAKLLGHRVLVVGPAGLRVNWFREAEAVQVPIEYHSWAKVPEVPEGATYTLIADEAHYAQNLKAGRTKALLALAKGAAAVYCLTGTPLKNGRPANLFPLLLATRHPLAADRKAYEVRYCNAGPTRWSKWDVTGAAHLDELHAKLKGTMLRRLKGECLDLPAKTRVLRTVDLAGAAAETYRATLRELEHEYRERKAAGLIKADADALVLITRLRHAGSVAKVEAAVELAEEVLEQGQQVVLFAAFRDSAEAVAAKLGAEVIEGGVSAADRQAAIDRFQRGDRKAIVCTFGAGGVGVTLTAGSTVILIDRPWTPGDAVQAEDRLHRIGQRGTVLALWLQANGADRKIDQLLVAKARRIEQVLAGQAAAEDLTLSALDVAEDLFGGSATAAGDALDAAPPRRRVAAR